MQQSPGKRYCMDSTVFHPERRKMKNTKLSLYHYDWVVAEDEGMTKSKGRSYSTIPGRLHKARNGCVWGA
jgi:hypothetical protein